MKRNRQLFKFICRASTVLLIHFIMTITLTDLARAENKISEKVLKQKISIELSDIDLRSALRKIKDKTNVHFTYGNKIIKQHMAVGLKAKDENLDKETFFGAREEGFLLASAPNHKL